MREITNFLTFTPKKKRGGGTGKGGEGRGGGEKVQFGRGSFDQGETNQQKGGGRKTRQRESNRWCHQLWPSHGKLGAKRVLFLSARRPRCNQRLCLAVSGPGWKRNVFWRTGVTRDRHRGRVIRSTNRISRREGRAEKGPPPPSPTPPPDTPSPPPPPRWHHCRPRLGHAREVVT